MNKVLVKGNQNSLVGEVKINGSKNSVLPIMAASLLSERPITLHNVPDIADVRVMAELLNSFGAQVKFVRNRDYSANHTLKISCDDITSHVAPSEKVNKLRASFLTFGAMLGRLGKVQIAFPGGCDIGKRSVDMHVEALEKMGAEIIIDNRNVIAGVKGKLKGNDISFKTISVGATENTIIAATLAEGTTKINNASTEPEVIDLINFLKKMGADIVVNKSEITIRGVNGLNGCSYTVIPDRIEAGTYALAAIMTDGRLKLEGINLADIKSMAKELEAIGANFESCDNGVIVSRKGIYIKPVNASTNAYPGFPTDMQPQLMSAMCIADGISTIEENIFENRFTHVKELEKLGAKIIVEKKKATVIGTKNLRGSSLRATDLRSAAALLLASLTAEGDATISDFQYCHRGYEAMHEKLNSCGASISFLN